jgi:hypothetical protein
MGADFASKLSLLVSQEMAAAHGDADRVGIVIERLLYSAAFSIAIASRGNQDGLSEMLQGAESYLYQEAAGLAGFSAAMARATNRTRSAGDK